jgi:hypothetical protein
VQVVIEPFFENTPAQVIHLPQQNLLDGQTKVNVLDPGLLCILGESGGLEDAVQRIG